MRAIFTTSLILMIACAPAALAGKGIVKSTSTPMCGSVSVSKVEQKGQNGTNGALDAATNPNSCSNSTGGMPSMAVKSAGVPGGPEPQPQPTGGGTPCAPYPGRPCPH